MWLISPMLLAVRCTCSACSRFFFWQQNTIHSYQQQEATSNQTECIVVVTDFSAWNIGHWDSWAPKEQSNENGWWTVLARDRAFLARESATRFSALFILYKLDWREAVELSYSWVKFFILGGWLWSSRWAEQRLAALWLGNFFDGTNQAYLSL